MRGRVAVACTIGLAVLVSLVFVLSGCATQKEAGMEETSPRERTAPEEQAAAPEERDQETGQEAGREQEPEVAREPQDSDGDGVPDELDRCPDTPRGVRVDGRGCPVVEKEGFTYQVTLLFDLDSAVLRREYIELRNEAVAFMEEHPEAELESVLVEGHADSTGTDAYNLKLSRTRAEIVRDYLVQNLGIAPGIVAVRAFGERSPVASNRTREGRRKNRRVVVTFRGVM
jgi:outer membrane protein OmpA-like peptidoglycan-associated protein